MMLLVSEHDREAVHHKERDEQHEGNQIRNRESDDELELRVKAREKTHFGNHHGEQVNHLRPQGLVLLGSLQQAVLRMIEDDSTHSQHENDSRIQHREDDVGLTHGDRQECEERAQEHVAKMVSSITQKGAGNRCRCVEEGQSVRIVQEIGKEDRGNGHDVQHPQERLFLFLRISR